MNSRRITILPALKALMEQMGENIKLARLRRKFSTGQVSERAGINRKTLWHIEKGSPQVAFGIYCQVLFVMGLAEDLLKITTDDELGRRLQDAELVVKKRAPKKNK